MLMFICWWFINSNTLRICYALSLLWAVCWALSQQLCGCA